MGEPADRAGEQCRQHVISAGGRGGGGGGAAEAAEAAGSGAPLAVISLPGCGRMTVATSPTFEGVGANDALIIEFVAVWIVADRSRGSSLMPDIDVTTVTTTPA